MQMTLTDIVGFFGIIASIAAGMWVILNRFGNLEGRVGKLEERLDSLETRMDRLEEKSDLILSYIAPKLKHKKRKHLHHKH